MNDRRGEFNRRIAKRIAMLQRQDPDFKNSGYVLDIGAIDKYREEAIAWCKANPDEQ